MFYFWLAIMIILGFIEVITINLVSIWFIISAFVSLIISFFTDNFVIQFGVFVILGIILMITTRKTLEKKLVKKEKTNLDRVIGMEGIITEDVTKHTIGEVKVAGKKWSCVSDKTIKKGSIVKILKIEGVKLKVEKVGE